MTIQPVGGCPVSAPFTTQEDPDQGQIQIPPRIPEGDRSLDGARVTKGDVSSTGNVDAVATVAIQTTKKRRKRKPKGSQLPSLPSQALRRAATKYSLSSRIHSFDFWGFTVYQLLDEISSDCPFNKKFSDLFMKGYIYYIFVNLEGRNPKMSSSAKDGLDEVQFRENLVSLYREITSYLTTQQSTKKIRRILKDLKDLLDPDKIESFRLEGKFMKSFSEGKILHHSPDFQTSLKHMQLFMDFVASVIEKLVTYDKRFKSFLGPMREKKDKFFTELNQLTRFKRMERFPERYRQFLKQYFSSEDLPLEKGQPDKIKARSYIDPETPSFTVKDGKQNQFIFLRIIAERLIYFVAILVNPVLENFVGFEPQKKRMIEMFPCLVKHFFTEVRVQCEHREIESIVSGFIAETKGWIEKSLSENWKDFLSQENLKGNAKLSELMTQMAEQAPLMERLVHEFDLFQQKLHRYLEQQDLKTLLVFEKYLRDPRSSSRFNYLSGMLFLLSHAKALHEGKFSSTFYAELDRFNMLVELPWFSDLKREKHKQQLQRQERQRELKALQAKKESQSVKVPKTEKKKVSPEVCVATDKICEPVEDLLPQQEVVGGVVSLHIIPENLYVETIDYPLRRNSKQREVEKYLKRIGFELAPTHKHVSGGHFQYTHPKLKGLLTVSYRNGRIGSAAYFQLKGMVKELNSMP